MSALLKRRHVAALQKIRHICPTLYLHKTVSAKGATLTASLGQRPGIRGNAKPPALKEFPGAMPQARVEIAPLALNTDAFGTVAP